MNMKHVAILLIAIILGLIAGIAYTKRPATSPVKNSPPVVPTLTLVPTPVIQGSLRIQSSSQTLLLNQPQTLTLAFRLDKDESQKGIIGVKTILHITGPVPVTIKTEDVKELLPHPWQYLKKSVSADTVTIEAVFLKPGVAGFVPNNEWQPLAAFTFTPTKSGAVGVSIDKQSELLSKEGNRTVPLNGEWKAEFTAK